LASERTFGAPFTATSMISFIALAGIIVRNSILLVDFIRHGTGEGEDTTRGAARSGSGAFQPILLTLSPR
jgi:multidrug efflux pump subunit AcrB